MNAPKEILLSWLSLAILVIGAAVVCLMGFPAGLLLILPGNIPHAVRLYRFYRPKKG